MSLWTRLYRGETAFDFVRASRTRWFIVSGVLIVVCLLSLGVRGLNLSLDFRGGVAVQVPNSTGAELADYRSAVEDAGFADARIQSLDDGAAYRVQTEALDPAEQSELTDAVAAVAGVTIDDTSVDSVGPTFGEEIATRAVEALVVFLAVVVVFISIRFEWKMAIAALIALTHDLILTFGVYSILGFEVTPSTVVAVLTILGYSLYDTVVVFDKVKENVDEFGDQRTYTAIVNMAMNQVLMRSINTSLTSLLPIGALLFVGSFLLGAGTLREFALALFVGVSAGTYSSLFIASPILALWKEREEEWSRRRYRVGRKEELRAEKGGAPEADVADTPTKSRRLSSSGQRSTTAPDRPASSSGAAPRPPKKGKRR